MRASSVLFAVAGIAAAAVVYRLVVAGRAAGSTVATAVADGVAAINPLNRTNVFARGADAVAQVVTGNPSTSLGTAVYDGLERLGIVPAAGAIATAPSLPRPVVRVSAADVAAAFDREDADYGRAMKAYDFTTTQERDDLEAGANTDQLLGKAYLGYRLTR